ncbi:hypothetical protein BJ165DRAFT_1415888 [Panaeolus papilionaceus]|nr:hypothetical protein BJ165DRAFT_1415888 [Panaeolus papilionaceus]
MGTRHLICIWWKDQWVVAQYGQWDGYPESQRVDIFQFLILPRNLENLKLGLERHTYQVSKEDLEAIHAECKQLYPCLTRDAAARVLGLIARAAVSGEDDEEDAINGNTENPKPSKKIPLVLSLTFANDGLFCEWAYVIDLDKEVLEIYGGSEHKHEGHRFKDVGSERDSVPAPYCSFTFKEIIELGTEKEFINSVLKKGGQAEDSDEAEE